MVLVLVVKMRQTELFKLALHGGAGGEYSYSIDGGLTFTYSSSGTLDIGSLGEGTYSVIAIDSNL